MEAKPCKHEYILALSKKSIQNNMDLVRFDLFHQHEFNLESRKIFLYFKIIFTDLIIG